MRIDSSLSVIEKKNREVLMNILKEHHPIVDELWQSCIDMDKITDLGNIPLRKDLNRIAKARDMETLMTMAGEFSRVGNNVLAKYRVLSDGRHFAVNLEASDLTLASDSYSDAHFPLIEKAYRAYIDSLIKLSGFYVQKDVSASDIVVRMEKQIIMSKRSNREMFRVSLYHIISHWPTTIGSFIKGTKLLEITSISEDLEIFVDYYYFHDLVRVVESASLEELKVYIAFLMIHSRVPWLGHYFYQLWFNFFQRGLGGMKEPQPREQICIDTVMKHLPDLIGDYFYKKSFDASRQKTALEMMEGDVGHHERTSSDSGSTLAIMYQYG